MVLSLVLLALTSLTLTGGSESRDLPDFPDYFTAGVEDIVELNGMVSQNVSREFFDGTAGLFRIDTGADTIIPEASGLVSRIIDPAHKIQYVIQRETRNCSVEPLTTDYGGYGLVLEEDGSYHFYSIQELFYLVNASEYTYVGNSSANGVILDDWMYVGDFDRPLVSYQDATIEVSIASNGAPSTYGENVGPVPWKISIEGRVISNYSGTPVNATISIASRIFDISFEEPHFDVFDVSVCSEPKDHIVMVMSVPKGPNNMVDFSSLRKNVRQSVVDYTQVAPIQVGNIEVVSDTGKALFTTVQISNMSVVANVSDAVTAQAAYDKIARNTNNGVLPFQIDVGMGNMVTPLSVEVKIAGSSTMPSSTTMVTTTVTITPTACPSATPCPTPTSSPSPAARGRMYSQRYVVGLGVGMVFFGAAIALLLVFVGTCVFWKFAKRFSMRTGYERHVNIES